MQEAKNKLSLLIEQAVSGDAQVIIVNGKPTAVVVSAEEYARLTNRCRGKLSSVLLRPDLGGEDLVLARSCGTGRETER